MNFVVVDNNKGDLAALAKAIAAVFLADRMCSVDGFILMRSLRKNKPVLPIVILSTSEQDKINAIHAAADGYLLKPVSANLLQRVVKQVIA